MPFSHPWYVLLWCDTALTCEATLDRDLTFSRSLVPEDRSRTASLSPTAMEAPAAAPGAAQGSGGGGPGMGGFEEATMVRGDSCKVQQFVALNKVSLSTINNVM